MLQDAAIQEGAPVTLPVPRQRVVAAAGLRQEGLQVLGQHLIEPAVFWLVALVHAREWSGGGVHASGTAKAAPDVFPV